MTVLVVGGRGGIGRVVVERLTSQGGHCLIADSKDGHDAAHLAGMTEFLRLSGVEALSGLVVLSGITGAGGVDATSVEEWRRVMAANLDAAFVSVKAALPLLRSSPDRGSIVLMSSVNARTGGNTMSGPAYAAAKAGILGLTFHLAKTLAAEGIRVNAVAPGPVSTPMLDRLVEAQMQGLLEGVPLGRVASAGEVADAVTYLLGPSAVSMTGSVIDLNGGMWMG